MDKLTWFKFTPSNWVMGKILKCPEITQARFIKLLCLYWNKDCVLNYEDAEIEVDKEHLDIMISKKVIKNIDDFIVIEFLNEQLEDISKTSEKRRKAVNDRWQKAKKSNTSEIQNNTSVSKKHTSVIQNDTDKSKSKIREELELEEIREDKKFLLEKETKKNNTVFDFKKSLINYGFNENLVDDWLKVRKTKKATNTKTAFDAFINEIESRGCDINEMLQLAVTNSWSGFKHKWVDNLKIDKNGVSKSNTEIFQQSVSGETARSFKY